MSALGLEVLDLPGRCADTPLVLLHEGLGAVSLWKSFPDDLAARTGRRVIAFSRHGHGESGPPPRPRTPTFHYEEAAEVLPALFEELGVREPVLVGHSDGGSIALIYAARFPVRALVLLAPHVFVEEMTLAAIRDTRVEYLEGDLRERMSRRHADPDAAFWGWCDVWLDPAFRSWNLEREVGQVGVPILLVQGSEDPYGSLEQLDRITCRARAPVRRVIVSGGHSPHREHGQRLVAEIARFVARVG